MFELLYCAFPFIQFLLNVKFFFLTGIELDLIFLDGHSSGFVDICDVSLIIEKIVLQIMNLPTGDSPLFFDFLHFLCKLIVHFGDFL